MNKIIVAVWMVTYNHEDFIVQAVESVMMQQTNFNYKLFIGEDCSTDATRDICKNLKIKYPNKIELILSDVNTGGKENAYNVYETCFTSGAKYIALLEGDDYWTDSLKLQKQVDFMETNPNYSICFHKVNILQKGVLKNDSSIESRYNRIKQYPVTTLDLLEQGNFIHTPSVLFRNYHIKFPIEFQYSSVGDYFLHIINSQHGLIKRLEDVMAVYREGVGIYSSLSSNKMFSKILIYQGCLLSYLEEDKYKEVLLKKFISNINQIENQYTGLGYLSENLTFKKLIKVVLLKLKNRFVK